MVSPPPGVSSGSRLPPIASVSPRARARPRPTPVALSVSPSRWNGTNARSRWSGGMPGPRSTTRSCTWSPKALAVSVGGDSDGACRMALPTRLATTRSSRTGSACTSGRVCGMSTRTRELFSPSSLSTAGITSSSEWDGGTPAGLRPAVGSDRAGCRPVGSAGRGPRRRCGAVHLRSAAGHSMSELRRLVTEALAAASGVRRSCPTARSSAVRNRSASANGLPRRLPRLAGPDRSGRRRARRTLRPGDARRRRDCGPAAPGPGRRGPAP